MATRRTNKPPVDDAPLKLVVSREDARAQLSSRLDKGRELRQRSPSDSPSFEVLKNDYKKWDAFNTQLLKTIATNGDLADEYGSWVGVLVVGRGEPSLGQKISELYGDIDKKVHRIDSIIERLEIIPLNQSLSGGATLRAPPGSGGSAGSSVRNNKVFIVHGHDEIAKTNLEVFLREIGLDPVVLHREADEGLTIIEKFEKHSDVGYAFILLTPDEIAYLAGEAAKDDKDRQKQMRARPNVIFEFGFFVGKLGRSRVCCLHTGNVTLPSDVNGIVYKPYLHKIDEVALSVIRDLKAAGYSIS